MLFQYSVCYFKGNISYVVAVTPINLILYAFIEEKIEQG